MRQLYYRIYRVLKGVKTNDMPAHNALLLLMILQWMNIGLTFMIINQLIGFRFTKEQGMAGALLGMGILAAANYFFIYRERDKIEERYKNESKSERAKGIAFLVAYVVISVLLFFGLGPMIVKSPFQ